MSNWEKVKLGDVCQFINGDRGENYPSAKDFTDKGIPFINAGHLVNKKIDFSNMNYISKTIFDKLGSGKTHKNDILYCLRGSLGKNAISNIDTGAIASSLVLLRCGEKLEPRFLLHCLDSRNIKTQQDSSNTGSSQPNLSATNVKAYTIPLPPIEEQKKVAEILDKACNMIFLRKKQIKKLDLLIKAKFIDMFGDQFVNPNGFEVVSFEQCINYIGDIGSNGANATISAHLKMSDKEDFALMVRTLNFTANDFNKNAKYVSKEVYDFFKKSQIFGGELIFNKIGSAGINFLMPYLNRPVSLGLNQIVVRIKDNVNMTYLYVLLNTEYGKYQIKSRIQGAVTKSITKGAIKNIPILFPPIELQNRFAEFVQQVDKQKLILQQGLEKLELTYNALMQQYFG